MKQYTSGVISLLAIITGSWCISRMIPYGLAGDTAMAILWFVLMMCAVVAGCVAGVAYYYFRSRVIADEETAGMRIAVQTLARSAEKPASTPNAGLPADITHSSTPQKQSN